MGDQNTRPQPSAEPVAVWLYEHPAIGQIAATERWRPDDVTEMWTETPLYPASALEAARREGELAAKREIAADLWPAMVKLQSFGSTAKGNGQDGRIWQSLRDGIDGLFALWCKHHFVAALKENPNG